MKNMLFFCLILFFLPSCEKETVSTFSENEIAERASIKIPVCHYDEDEGTWKFKDVNINSLPSHIAHGDIRLDDQDGDGFVPDNECNMGGPQGDCNDTNATIYPGAEEIPGDDIDQDCDGEDAPALYCPCFSQESLEDLYDVAWQWGWWSDVPGCKNAPYENLLELWITNAGLPNDNYNFSAQAGTINGNAFASSAIFNHETGQFDLLCGGYTTPEIAEPCRQILSNFIQDLRISHPTWDFCVRFP